MVSTEIRLLLTGDEPAVEAFLRPHLASSLFLLGNMRLVGLVDNGDRYQGTYVAAFEDGRIAGIVAHYWNGNIILQAPKHVEPLVEAVARFSGRAIHGLIGPFDQVLIAKALLEYDDGAIQLDSREWLYRLELNHMIVPEGLKDGLLKARRLGDDDVDLITQWRIAYEVETLGAEDTPEVASRCRSQIQREVGTGKTWLLEKDGRVISMTGFNVKMPDVVQVGGVYTPPEFRGRGYARAVVAASLLDAQADSVDLAVLFTQEDNVAAQRAYKALGFRRVGTYYLLLLREAARLVI